MTSFQALFWYILLPNMNAKIGKSSKNSYTPKKYKIISTKLIKSLRENSPKNHIISIKKLNDLHDHVSKRNTQKIFLELASWTTTCNPSMAKVNIKGNKGSLCLRYLRLKIKSRRPINYHRLPQRSELALDPISPHKTKTYFLKHVMEIIPSNWITSFFKVNFEKHGFLGIWFAPHNKLVLDHETV